jgi:hypothetical protein
VILRDWSSDVCSSDLSRPWLHVAPFDAVVADGADGLTVGDQVRPLQAGDSFRLARNVPPFFAQTTAT